MSDERVRELERAVRVQDPSPSAARESLTRELRRLGRAFADCDWCWGAGFRVTHRRALDTETTLGWVVLYCEHCQRGEPLPRPPETLVPTGHAHRPSESHWRRQAQAVIAPVLAANPTRSAAELRRALSAVYPFGQRRYYPYKVWLEEVRNAMDTRR